MGSQRIGCSSTALHSCSTRQSSITIFPDQPIASFLVASGTRISSFVARIVWQKCEIELELSTMANFFVDNGDAFIVDRDCDQQ